MVQPNYLTTLATPQLSVVVLVPRATPLAVHKPASASTITSTGHVIDGSSLSCTVTICSQVAVLPLSSVTVHITLVVPSPYGSTELFTTLANPQLSVVVLVPNAPPLAVH